MPRTNKPTGQASDQPTPRRAAAKRSNGRADAAANGIDHHEDAVARRAYEIYESRGAQHGFDLDHWLEAERELRPAPPKPRRAKKTPQAGA